MDAPILCHLLAKHETEAFNSAHCAKEQLHGNVESRQVIWIFILLAFFFSFKTHHSQTHELCLINWGSIPPSLPRTVPIPVPIIQAQLLIVATFTLKSAPVWLINARVILHVNW